MKIAMLAPIAWRTPPRHYGPWERVVSLLTEELVSMGADVTLFATADSITGAKLRAVCPAGYEESSDLDPKVAESLHISQVFEGAAEFDLIHNHFDFLPLTYSGLVNTPVVTTIHGFSSAKILPVYQKYNRRSHYVSISDADRSPHLVYLDTVYHGIDLENFTYISEPDDYLLFFSRIHPDKGAREAIEIARLAGRKLILAGIIQDRLYYEKEIKPHLDGIKAEYIGSVGAEKRNQILGKAYALLHPINFHEPFGLSVVEAMACGTPVIAFSRGSMPELIREGETGFLASSIKVAAEAVENIPFLERKRCRREVAERFTAERMAEDYLKIYRQVLKSGN